LLAANDSHLVVQDLRQSGVPVPYRFVGDLTGGQQKAATAILGQDIGILVAPPGTGKTVIGTYLVAARGVSTLVLVQNLCSTRG
jgi:superfamily II DNA or RNA helicase